MAAQFVKVEAGHYQTGDGRFVLWALSGWWRGYWELIDIERRTRRQYDSKRAALAAFKERGAEATR